MKKLLSSMALLLVLVSLFSIQASAITKTDYINYLRSKGFAKEYIVYAQNHFKSNNYTSKQLDSLKMYSNIVLGIVMPKNPEVVTKGGKYFDKAKFTQAEEDEILKNVIKAADSLGIKSVVTRGADSIRRIDFYNSKGKKIGSVTPKYNVLKYTGPESSVNVYIISAALLVLVLAGGTIITTRVFYLKKKSNETDVQA